MNTLMRTLTRFGLRVLMIVGTTLTLSAQAAPEVKPQAPEPQVPPAAAQPQTPAPASAQQPQQSTDTPGRFSFSVSVGGQSQEQTFTDSSTCVMYGERVQWRVHTRLAAEHCLT